VILLRSLKDPRQIGEGGQGADAAVLRRRLAIGGGETVDEIDERFGAVAVQQVVDSLQAEDGVGGEELAQVAQRLVGLPEEGVQLQCFLLRLNGWKFFNYKFIPTYISNLTGS